MPPETKHPNYKEMYNEALVELEKEKARNEEYRKTNQELWADALRLMWQAMQLLKVGATHNEIFKRMPEFRKHYGEDAAEELERKWRRG